MIVTTDSLLEFYNLGLLIACICSLWVLIVSWWRMRRGEDELYLYPSAVSLFPVLLIIVVVRTYVFEPFRIPSESMFPLLTTGDVIYVSKTSYDLKFPLTNVSLMKLKDPQRGDVAVFKYPLNLKSYFVKRVIGVPGDRLVWKGDNFYINGQLIQRNSAIPARKDLGEVSYVRYSNEHLNGRDYLIRRLSKDDSTQFTVNSYFLKMRTDKAMALQGKGLDQYPGYLELTVPQGFYFTMGDNRDQSLDSRAWGLVNRDNFVGKAIYNLVNINPNAGIGLTEKISFTHFGVLD